MSFNPIGEGSSRSTALRRPNADGTVTIVCRRCGKPIIRSAYTGFTTATCSDCAGISTEGVITGATMLPDGRVVYQAEQRADSILYPDSPEVEKVGLARAIFRALGFGRAKEPVPEATASKKIAREKKRQPLFDSTDED